MFTVLRGKIKGRFDPVYYKGYLFEILKNSKFPVKKIGLISKKMKSGFGAGKQDQTEDKSAIIQIRPTNINNLGFLKFDKNIYISEDKIPSVNHILEKDTVLFNNTNSQELVGKTGIVTNNEVLTFSNHITAIEVNKQEVLPQYLWLILNFYQKKKVFYSICTNWNNQSGVGIDLLKSIEIPVPPLSTQQEIVNSLEKDTNAKHENEKQAKELLSGIDDYLLNELGIKIPEKEEQNIFTTTHLTVKGKRLDPNFYHPNSVNLIKSVENSKYPKEILRNLIIHSVAGDWGKDENAKVNVKEYITCLVIRATEFDNNYNLKIKNSRAKKRQIKKEKFYKLDIQANDLLIEKSGGSPDQPVGRIAIIETNILNNNNLCFSNFIQKMRIDESKINPEYLFCFLKLVHNIKITEIMQSQTTGIRNLIMNEYFSQKIVLPPIKKQNEIAEYIKNRRDKAYNLQKEAKENYKNTKEEIEKMIINNNTVN